MLTPQLRRELGAQRSQVSHLIKYELGVRGYTLSSLAAMLGCSVNNISQVVNGNGHSPTVLAALRNLGVPEEYLFDPNMASPATKSEKQ